MLDMMNSGVPKVGSNAPSENPFKMAEAIVVSAKFQIVL